MCVCRAMLRCCILLLCSALCAHFRLLCLSLCVHEPPCSFLSVVDVDFCGGISVRFKIAYSSCSMSTLRRLLIKSSTVEFPTSSVINVCHVIIYAVIKEAHVHCLVKHHNTKRSLKWRDYVHSWRLSLKAYNYFSYINWSWFHLNKCSSLSSSLLCGFHHCFFLALQHLFLELAIRFLSVLMAAMR